MIRGDLGTSEIRLGSPRVEVFPNPRVGAHPSTRSISGGCWCPVRAAMPVTMLAWLVHPARLYGASGLCLGVGAHGYVLCWGVAGGALPVVVCCDSCFVHVCRCLQCACSVVPTCVPASLVLLLMPIALYAWCYVVLLHWM